jgi:hypothetical protein
MRAQWVDDGRLNVGAEESGISDAELASIC